MTLNELLRQLPSVDEVLVRLAHLDYPRPLIVSEARRILDQARTEIRAGRAFETESIAARVEQSLANLDKPSLRRVINATGVVLHTNLGRAPLAPFDPLVGYSNLEYDLREGRRGKRDGHAGDLLKRLIGAPGIVVNNNAAAVYLALNELAAGYEVIVSRGELIEIGDGFRIPDIMRNSGAILREVGTTNRTRIEDYEAAITDRTRLLLRVHPSNFHLEGFTSKPDLTELALLARERAIPLYEDLGSGCMADLSRFGIREPLVSESLRAGVNLVSFSGDKLLGGPQAGILAGDAPLVDRVRRNPMFRALRVDKLMYQALETTLRNYLFERWGQIPALRMIGLTSDELKQRAEQFAARLHAEVIPGESVIGGGSTPAQSLPTWLVAVDCADVVYSERRCREGDPPVIARIENNRLLLDLRTVFPNEEEVLAKRIEEACQARS
ncbi:MAG TPA: L-seryl-tRNA(Sec) selenium transferase [Bryobacteraceae bacterium]|nr:L-seryl-tRNA(Sec) selenium transferase [Bryobacteraceae bacterium]